MKNQKFIIGEDRNGESVYVDPFVLSDTRALITASSGLGKSWLLRVIAESVASKIQTILIDPAGEFPTLREKLDILVVGINGDIQADIRSAPLLARRLCETGVSAVIDIYDIPGKGDPWEKRRLFVGQFLNALMEVPKSLYHPMLIKIDEAHMFAPEGKTGGGERLAEHYIGERIAPAMFSLAAVNLLMSGGRKYGFGGLLATQRISKINKDAVADARNKFLGGATLDNDQRRTGDELGMTKAESVGLRDLEPGEFYSYGPALQGKGVILFKSAPVQTTHPKAGQRTNIIVPKASTQIKTIIDQLGDIPAEAEEEIHTMESLRAENARLARELTNRPKVEIPKAEIQYIEKSVISNDQIFEIQKMAQETQVTGETLESLGRDFIMYSNQILSALAVVRNGSNNQAPPARPGPTPTLPTLTPRLSGPSADPGGSLPVGEKKILSACAQYDGVDRKQLTVLTGYKKTSRDAYISRLLLKGFLEVGDNRKVYATQTGIDALGADYDPLPTGQALQDYWRARLPVGERIILEAAINSYPHEIRRDQIEGYKKTSRDAYISRLQAKELIQTTGPGTIRASDNLFNL